MKKILLAATATAALFGSQFQFGKGKFSVDANFLGLDSSKTENIKTFSLLTEHKNIFSTKYFYGYKVAYYKSNTLTTTYNYMNSFGKAMVDDMLLGSSQQNSNKNINENSQGQDENSITTAPQTIKNTLLIYNKLRGVDLNVVLGRDLINQDNKDTYLGIGLLVGASFPYLDTKSNNNNDKDYLKKSKTKFYTYKVGITLRGEKSFKSIWNFYGSFNYAKQKAKVKNNILHLDSSSDGDNFSFNTGIKLQAKTKKKIWKITLSPAVFATLGYRYDYWKVKDVKINSLSTNTDIKLKISQVYVGLGYDF